MTRRAERQREAVARPCARLTAAALALLGMLAVSALAGCTGPGLEPPGRGGMPNSSTNAGKGGSFGNSGSSGSGGQRPPNQASAGRSGGAAGSGAGTQDGGVLMPDAGPLRDAGEDDDDAGETF